MNNNELAKLLADALHENKSCEYDFIGVVSEKNGNVQIEGVFNLEKALERLAPSLRLVGLREARELVAGYYRGTVAGQPALGVLDRRIETLVEMGRWDWWLVLGPGWWLYAWISFLDDRL